MAEDIREKIIGHLRAPNSISERVQQNQPMRLETSGEPGRVGGKMLIHVRGRSNPIVIGIPPTNDMRNPVNLGRMAADLGSDLDEKFSEYRNAMAVISDSMNDMQKMSLMTGAMPIAPDVLGLLGDMQMYIEEPESRTLFNGFLTMLGAAAGAPAMAGAKNAMGTALKKNIDAWHGSPHKFDKFSMSELGTGEGAQAYGHGLYFAENKGVGEGYRDQLSRHGWSDDEARSYAEQLVRERPDMMELEGARPQDLEPDGDNSFIHRLIEDWGSDELKKASAREGSLYNVNLNADPDELLDWDAPLSEQLIEKVDSLVKGRSGKDYESGKYFFEVQSQGDNVIGRLHGDPDMKRIMGFGDSIESAKHDAVSQFTGQDLYLSMGDQEAASKTLNELGIPGIRYYDGGSRGAVQQAGQTIGTREKELLDEITQATASGDTAKVQQLTQKLDNLETVAQPTRNFVIFDDSLIDIKTRNGESLTPVQRQEAVKELTPAPKMPSPAAQTSVFFDPSAIDARYSERIKTLGGAKIITPAEIQRLGGLNAMIESRKLDIPQVSIADFEGRPFITSMSDRTAAGGRITGINDVQFDDAIDLRGGQDYMFDHPNEGQVWASDPKVVNSLQRAAQGLAEETGESPIFLPWRMAPTGGDFSTMTGEAMLKYARQNMSKSDIAEINKTIRETGYKVDGAMIKIPEFKGIESSESIAQLSEFKGPQRKAINFILDRKGRETGGLSLTEARVAVSDQSQLTRRDAGLQNVGEIDVNAPIIENSGHPTYPAGLPGRGLGALKEDIGVYEMMPEVSLSRGIPDSRNPRATDNRALQMKPYTGIITEEMLRKLGL